ncbi:MAG: alpha/beta fold hydrolase [Pseudomonadaceae bacterium]|nr:alpha/beta fold hydrolase [Pseudomonadaceae bacterium]
MTRWGVFLAGWIVIFSGAGLAHFIQTSSDVTIEDIRFQSAGGKTLSALLYLPADATTENKAPAILAVHGYINSREVQSGFAIEFARRGYVVLALDQTGHGYSDPPAFSEGFGGPDALQYLHSLDVVDTNNIGLEGHSMGGWAVLAAAAAMPDGYRSVVLQGSSTGPPFAADGTPTWPRNIAVVFAQFDEFAELMWGVRSAQDVNESAKLQALFGTEAAVIPNTLYGNINTGSARMLMQPPVTHPGNHLSQASIAAAVDWFAQTLEGGQSLDSSNQIWFVKEMGTLIALIGLVILIIGSLRLFLSFEIFSSLVVSTYDSAIMQRNSKWWLLAGLSAFIPVATFYPLFNWAEAVFPPNTWFAQGITNQIVVWALFNAAAANLIMKVTSTSTSLSKELPGPSLALACLVVSIAYLAVFVVDLVFTVDFRFWFVGLKALSLTQLQLALIYVVPFLLYFIGVLRPLHGGLSVERDGWLIVYTSNALAMMGGFLLFLIAQYAYLFSTGTLLTPNEPLNTIVMIQFVPLLLIVSIISTCAFCRTNRYLPGALVNTLFVTWYIVAGQATQVA